MATNAEKLQHLNRLLTELEREVAAKQRQDECMRLLDQITAKPAEFREITDDDWAAMLPKEKDKTLPAYYCSCRLRLKQLQREMTEQKKEGTLQRFMSSAYVEGAIKLAELAALG